MSKPNRNDISIGKNRWITFVDTAHGQGAAVDLDVIIEPIWQFLALLETECVATCCGIDAFGLWPNDIARAANEFSSAGLHARIVVVREQVAAMTGEVFVSCKLNWPAPQNLIHVL